MENENAPETYALCASSANKKLAARIEARGGRVVFFPPVETEKAALDEKSAGILENLAGFDWLIFADIFAADYFIRALEENDFDFYELDALRICTLGEAVADRLRFAQVHADVVAASVKSGAVAASLAAYIGAAKIGGARFLFIKRVQSAESEIETALKEMGAPVTTLEIYGVKNFAASNERARFKALFAGGAIDEFVFATPADFIALAETAARPMIEEFLRDARISATDELTLQFLRENDVPRACLFAANKKG